MSEQPHQIENEAIKKGPQNLEAPRTSSQLVPGSKTTKFFEQIAPVSGGAKEIIQHPYLEFNAQKQFNLLFAERYNLHILAKREEAQEDKVAYQGLEPFQSLRSQHIKAMDRLGELAAREMEHRIKHLAIHNLHTLDPNEGLSVFVSNPFLAKDWRTTERSVQRIIKRLRTAGFIEKKIWHGTRAQYELVLSPKMLLTTDLADLDYHPRVELPLGNAAGERKTVEWAPEERLKTKWLHIVPSRGNTSSNLIKPVRKSAPQSGFTAKPERDTREHEGTLEGTPESRTGQGNTREQGAGGREKIKALKPLAVERQTVTTEKAGNFQNYLLVKALIIYLAAERMLWPDREIYPGAADKAVQYIAGRYFQGCRTENAVDERVGQVLHLVKVGQKWKEGDPQRRHHLLPKQFFDLDRKRKHSEDYAGIVGLNKLVKERSKTEKIKESKFKKNKNLHDLRKYIKTYEKQPTIRKSQKLIERVQQTMPEMAPQLERYFIEGVKP